MPESQMVQASVLIWCEAAHGYLEPVSCPSAGDLVAAKA